LALKLLSVDFRGTFQIVFLHVPLKISWLVKPFATQLAGNHENGVHTSPMHMQINL
jgi:hypothetical protein